MDAAIGHFLNRGKRNQTGILSEKGEAGMTEILTYRSCATLYRFER